MTESLESWGTISESQLWFKHSRQVLYSLCWIFHQPTLQISALLDITKWQSRHDTARRMDQQALDAHLEANQKELIEQMSTASFAVSGHLSTA